MLSKLLATTTALAADRRGAIAPIFGVAVTAIMLTAGFAIDYSRAAAARTYLQSALDASALAAAKAMATGTTDTAALTKVAREMFDANFQIAMTEKVETSAFKVVADTVKKTVSVTASAKMPTTFMSIASIDDLEVGSSSTTSVDGTKFEVAMMVDMTGSMASKPKGGGPTKIASLKSASTDFINTMLPSSGVNNDIVKIGIVPFAASVNAGAYASAATGGKSTSCVVERYASGAIDASDTSGAVAPVGTSKSASCPSNQVRPLTNNRTALLDDVTKFSTSGTTAGHLGTIWARYVLSAKWGDVWPAGKASANGTKGVKKVAILMTDGLYNTSYSEKGASTFVEPNSASTDAALAACQAMDKEGIVVYTIGFDLSGASGTWAKKLMQDCASTITDQNGKKVKAFYDVSDGAALKAAYADIAAQLLRIRVSS